MLPDGAEQVWKTEYKNVDRSFIHAEQIANHPVFSLH